MAGQSMSFEWGGVARTFDYWLPKGWIQFIEDYQGINPVRGLPVLIMLHGGSDSSAPSGPTSIDPGNYGPTAPTLAMLDNWPFHKFADRRKDQAWPNDPTNDDVETDDRFAVVVPHAFKPNHGKGVWNAGYGERLEFLPDDVGFIKECIIRLAAAMEARLTALGRSIPADGALDRRRHFIFGYSNGGMMAYRLVTDDFFASRVGALCVVAGAAGGVSHENLPPGGGPTHENKPKLFPNWQTLPSTISLLAIHGVKDTAVKPGGITEALDTRNWSQSSRNYFLSGGLTMAQASTFRRSDLNLRTAGEFFGAFAPNSCTVIHTVSGLPSVVTGGATEGRIRRRAGAPAPQAIGIPFKGFPGRSYPWFITVNPEIWLLYDGEGDHGNIQSDTADNRWPDVAFVWAWLRRHRKVNGTSSPWPQDSEATRP